MSLNASNWLLARHRTANKNLRWNVNWSAKNVQLSPSLCGRALKVPDPLFISWVHSFQAISPEWSLIRKNNWIEQNVNLMWKQRNAASLIVLLIVRLCSSWPVKYNMKLGLTLTNCFIQCILQTTLCTCSSLLGRYSIFIIVVCRGNQFSPINLGPMCLQRCFHQSNNGHRASVSSYNLLWFSAETQRFQSQNKTTDVENIHKAWLMTGN